MAITKISSALIGANTIATANIADNAVDGTKIAQNSILTKHIDDAQITTGHIIDANVTTAKIADDAVTLAKLAGLARGKIIYGDASGNPAALALGSNGTVLKSDGTDIAWGTDATVAALTSEQVQDIAGAMFSSNTETGITATYQDADGTIDLVIGANVIVAGMIAQNSILTRHIDDNQVTADQIAAATITTTQIAANTIATGNVADNAIDGTKIASNSILTRHIDDDQVTGAQLSDNIDIAGTLDVTGALVADSTITASGTITTLSNVNSTSGNDLRLNAGSANRDVFVQVNGTTLLTAVGSTGLVKAAKSAMITEVALTNASTVVWDAAGKANATLALNANSYTGNVTIAAPSNAVAGAIISVEIAQDGTPRTVAWNTIFEFAASTAPVVTATANKTDIFAFRYNGSVWQEIGRVQNMAQT